MAKASKLLSLLNLSGHQVTGDNEADVLSALKNILSLARDVDPTLPVIQGREYKDLLGATPEEEIEVNQWLSFTRTNPTLTKEHVQTINNVLSKKTYLVGQRPTLADLDVYLTLLDSIDLVTPDESGNVVRWLDHVQHLVHVAEKKTFSFPTLSIPVPVLDQATPAAKKVEEKAAEPIKVEANVAPEKKKDEKKKDAPTPAAAPAVGADAEASAELDPSKLDIRVGQVVKCWNHEGSEKLLCEEIDLGEGNVRNIASGIRAFYNAEQLVGRKVLVVANLKERSIAGFKSQGMVLCACNSDHSQVALVEVPADAKVGERVLFPGFSSEPATPAQMVKKKILETLAPGLRTDGEGVARWKEVAFTLHNEVCRAPLINATVS
eukprot:gene10118-11200_t